MPAPAGCQKKPHRVRRNSLALVHSVQHSREASVNPASPSSTVVMSRSMALLAAPSDPKDPDYYPPQVPGNGGSEGAALAERAEIGDPAVFSASTLTTRASARRTSRWRGSGWSAPSGAAPRCSAATTTSPPSRTSRTSRRTTRRSRRGEPRRDRLVVQGAAAASARRRSASSPASPPTRTGPARTATAAAPPRCCAGSRLRTAARPAVQLAAAERVAQRDPRRHAGQDVVAGDRRLWKPEMAVGGTSSSRRRRRRS